MCISRYQYILFVQALNTDKTWFRAAKEKVVHIVGYDSLSLNDATKIIIISIKMCTVISFCSTCVFVIRLQFFFLKMYNSLINYIAANVVVLCKIHANPIIHLQQRADYCNLNNKQVPWLGPELFRVRCILLRKRVPIHFP